MGHEVDSGSTSASAESTRELKRTQGDKREEKDTLID